MRIIGGLVAIVAGGCAAVYGKDLYFQLLGFMLAAWALFMILFNLTVKPECR